MSNLSNLRHLKSFAAIVDAGGYARAAELLRLSQPALSRQISALEQDLGVRLFERAGRGVRLTSEGEELLRHARRLLGEAADLGERARALSSGIAGTLRIGATPQVIETLLADFMRGYSKAHPRVEVELVESGGALMWELLERREIEVGIMPAGDDRFASALLYPMILLAVLPTGHPLAGRSQIDVADLAYERVMTLGRGFASHLWFEQACASARVRPRVLLESRAPHTVIALARTGYGVALVPSPVEIPRRGVAIVPVVRAGATVGRWTVAAWDGRRCLPPFVGAFVNDLVSATRADYPGRGLVDRAPPLPRPSASRNPATPVRRARRGATGSR